MVLAEIELGAQTVNMIAFLIGNCYQLAHKCKYLPGPVIWLELVQYVGVGALLFENGPRVSRTRSAQENLVIDSTLPLIPTRKWQVAVLEHNLSRVLGAL